MHNVEPDMTREGGSIPVTLVFQEATGKNVMLLPMGCADDGAHSQNEKINKSNFLNGVCFNYCHSQVKVTTVFQLEEHIDFKVFFV